MANKGYFVITDICGYIEYLVHSELDHTNEILQYLFNTQIEAIKHPFVISDFHGDAIFMYVPKTNFVAQQNMLEALEELCFVFANHYNECNPILPAPAAPVETWQNWA